MAGAPKSSGPAAFWRRAAACGPSRARVCSEGMQADPFEEAAFFDALASSGARVLLIGRRALVALGIPVGTFDYDLWVHIDDIQLLNDALAPFDLFPNKTPEQARATGMYVLENGEKVDVFVARSAPTKDGALRLEFDDAWARRCTLPYGERGAVTLPSIPDLILTKRWAMRPKDVLDIQALEVLLRKASS